MPQSYLHPPLPRPDAAVLPRPLPTGKHVLPVTGRHGHLLLLRLPRPVVGAPSALWHLPRLPLCHPTPFCLTVRRPLPAVAILRRIGVDVHGCVDVARSGGLGLCSPSPSSIPPSPPHPPLLSPSVCSPLPSPPWSPPSRSLKHLSLAEPADRKIVFVHPLHTYFPSGTAIAPAVFLNYDRTVDYLTFRCLGVECSYCEGEKLLIIVEFHVQYEGKTSKSPKSACLSFSEESPRSKVHVW